jgi:Acetyltransferase (GNAT) domain
MVNEPWRSVVFRRPWWLDAVSEHGWGESTVEEGGRVRAHLPYAVRRLPLGAVALGSPPLTPWLGPWLGDGARGAHDLTAELIDRLPRFDWFSQTFDPQVTDWLPFHWKGFSAVTRYTYRLGDVGDPDRVWAGIGDKTRNVVRRAQRDVVVRDDLPVDDMLRLVGATFARQDLDVPFTPELLRKVYQAAVAHASGKALYAVDGSGRVHATAMIVWDEHWTYYLLGGGDPQLRQSGATSLLIWEAIRFAAGVSQGFDFEGSMLPGVERFFRGFGAQQVPYFAVRKASRRMRVALAARELARAVAGRT